MRVQGLLVWVALSLALISCTHSGEQPTTADIADYMGKRGYSELTSLKAVPAVCQVKPEDITGLHCGKDPILASPSGGPVVTCSFHIQKTDMIIRADNPGAGWRITSESVYPPLPESLCRPDSSETLHR